MRIPYWIFWLVFLLLSTTTLNAQNERIDSLIDELDLPTTTDSMRMKIYSQVIWPNTWQNAEKALGLTSEMMRIARANEWQRYVLLAHYYYGTTYKNSNEHKKALLHIDSAYTMAQTTDNMSMEANSAYQKAVININAGELVQAMHWCNKTIEGYKLLGDDRSTAMTLNAKGGVYRQLRLYQEALDSYGEALSISSEQGDSLNVAQVHGNMGNVYAEIDSFESALYHYGLQEKIDSVRKDTFGLAFVYENRGRLFEKMDRLEDAEKSLRASLLVRKKYSNKKLLAASAHQLASVLAKLGRDSEAIKILEEAEDYATQGELTQELANTAMLRARTEEKKGNYQAAYDWLKEHIAKKEETLNDEISRQALQINAATDFENLQREKDLQLQAYQLKQSKRTTFWALIVAALFAFFLFLIGRSRYMLQQAKRKLEDQKEEITKTLEEKDYLLKEIHHRVKNNLQVISSLLRLQARSLSDDGAIKALNEGHSRIRSMALIHQNLYQDAADLRAINTAAYLSQLVSGLFTSYRADPDRITFDLNIEELKLDIDTIIPIGLIINELVSNALKYAFPQDRQGAIRVSLAETDEGTLELMVKDDGVGFKDLEVAKESFGLRMIDAFAKRLRAEVDIDSSDGTTAMLTIRNYRKAS